MTALCHFPFLQKILIGMQMEISLLWRQMNIFVDTCTFQLQFVLQNHVCVDMSSKGFQRFLTMTINVRIMPAASEQSLFIQSGLNAAAGRKETELIYYFSPDFHSTHFFTWPIFFNRPIFSLGPFFTQLAFSLNLTNSA